MAEVATRVSRPLVRTRSHFWWAHRIPGNASYVAVSFFNSNGTAFAVAGLAGEQVTKFSFAVPNCTAATACRTDANRAGVRRPGSHLADARLLETRENGRGPWLVSRVDGCRGLVVEVDLVYWNETLGDWDNQGVYRDNATILASGDNCTFVGYSTHFTVFTIGVISFELNVVDPAAVRGASLGERAGGRRRARFCAHTGTES